MNIIINSMQEEAVNITEEELLILNMLRGRLFTPIEAIINALFEGDTLKATESIQRLKALKMLDYAVYNRITITVKGKRGIGGEKNCSLSKARY
jgi:hypothetical protein